MAIRPVYEVICHGDAFVKIHEVDFQWFSGFAIIQKQKSIESLHAAFKSLTGKNNVLEISSKSKNELGVLLSAFNLGMTTKTSKRKVSVESAFQGSKKFAHGGPYQDLYYESSKKDKKDSRLKDYEELVGFQFFGEDWPTEPKTLFYDWIYLNALYRNKDLNKKILEFSAFTDIEFNPVKSINCQAYSAALYVSLVKRGILEKTLQSRANYMELLGVKISCNRKESCIVKSKQLSLPCFDQFESQNFEKSNAIDYERS